MPNTGSCLAITLGQKSHFTAKQDHCDHGSVDHNTVTPEAAGWMDQRNSIFTEQLRCQLGEDVARRMLYPLGCNKHSKSMAVTWTMYQQIQYLGFRNKGGMRTDPDYSHRSTWRF